MTTLFLGHLMRRDKLKIMMMMMMTGKISCRRERGTLRKIMLISKTLTWRKIIDRTDNIDRIDTIYIIDKIDRINPEHLKLRCGET